jgi:hypothetical protein
MLTSVCRNCGNAKSPAEYANNYCNLCDANIKEKVEHAVKTGADTDAARREALAERAHNSSRNRPDPRGFVPRVDTSAFDARIQIEPGSPGDPRLGGR